MAIGSVPPPAIDEGDLHRFVDGLLDPQRQHEVALRLKTRVAEAAQVAAWREQNELLRSAFAGVEHDPVPASLRLTPLRLRCVGDDERAADASLPRLPKLLALDRQARPARLFIAVGLCLAAAVLGASWLMLDRAASSKPRSLLVASREPDGLLTTPAFLEDRARINNERQSPAEELPTTSIPDLGPVGFEFTGAAVRASLPKALVFSYQGIDSSHLTLSVSRSVGSDSGGTTRAEALAWERGGRSFVLGGDGDHLPSVAAYLQSITDAAQTDAAH